VTSPVICWLLSNFVSAAPITASVDALTAIAAPEGQHAEPAAAVAHGSVPAARGAQATREEQAFSLYQAGRFAEAGLEFEALWVDFADPRYLYNAASSRFAVGHFAHAADYLARYLETPGLAADDRGDASGQLAAARGHLLEVRVRVEGEATSVMVEHIPELASDRRPPLEIGPMGPGESGESIGTIALDPAQWRFYARSADGREASQELAVGAGGPLEVSLIVPQEDVPEAPAAISLRPHTLGFGVGGGGLALVGLGLTIGTSVQANRLGAGDACAPDPTICRQRLVRNLNARSWGAGLVGLGLGAATGGLTGLIRDSRRRNTAWIAEAATGGALLIGGTASVLLGARMTRALTAPSEASWDDFGAWSSAFADEGAGGSSLHSVGGLLLGLGGGLTASAVTGLLLQRGSSKRLQSKRKVELGASLRGISLRGAF